MSDTAGEAGYLAHRVGAKWMGNVMTMAHSAFWSCVGRDRCTRPSGASVMIGPSPQDKPELQWAYGWVAGVYDSTGNIAPRLRATLFARFDLRWAIRT